MSLELPAQIAEAIEADFMHQYVSNATRNTIQDLGIASTRVAGGVILSVRNDETRYWSKALGFGFSEPVTAELIDRILGYYRSEGNSGATIQIAPSVMPPDWEAIRRRNALTPAGTVVKLACPADEFRVDANTDLVIDEVDAADIERWTQVAMRGFGMPMNLVPMVAAGTRSSGFHPFAAWDGDDMVATANLLIRDGVASLNTGATLETHRNRGAQSALIAARAGYAKRAGCRWLVAETGQPALGSTNPSLDNLLRAGFIPQYTRVDWTWQLDRPAR
jgi:GNAT superfamily N-acetyltransferase